MSKKPRGNIHKIREFELEKIHLVDEFDILQIVGEGWFGKILLVEHRGSQTEMVLKAVPKPYVSIRDFFREFHYGLHLGIHRNIVTTYDVAFETAGFYIFTQEYAPLGDLTSNVTDTGVGEEYTKRVAKQIGAALDYMHAKDIVHRDVKLDNVLIYRSDFTRVKICDFGESYQAGTIVERRNEWLPYSPPEVLEIKPEGTYTAEPSHDVWQFGIVIFVCLTGCLPWQKAASDDPRYVRYLTWFGANILPMRRTPKLFKLLSSRAQRMFKRFLDPRAERRPKNLTDLSKFLDDRWLAKTAEKEMAEYETDELCPSMYSFHSSPDEKHRLLYTLANCGLETNVDRQSKKNRIKDWIEASVITEEDEEEVEDASPSSSVSREPVAGHISSIRATLENTKAINSTLKDAAQKHFDPRTGALQEGPSEMGAVIPSKEKSYSPSIDNASTLNNGDSLCGSLLTLGSRPDLLQSHLEIYNSDLNLNRLGEQNSAAQFYGHNQSLSSSNLLMSEYDSKNSKGSPAAAALKATTKKSIGIDTYGLPNEYPKSALKRSKSDSVKTVMFASTPAINDSDAYNAGPKQLNNATNQTLTKANTLNDSSPIYANTNSNTNLGNVITGKVDAPKPNSSTTLTGLANAFHSLASISLPTKAAAAEKQQQQQKQLQQQQQQQQYQLQQQQKQQQQMQQLQQQQQQQQLQLQQQQQQEQQQHEQHQQQQQFQQQQEQQLQQQQQQSKQQQFAKNYLKQEENNFSIRDSAYGSADVSEGPSRTVSSSSMRLQNNNNNYNQPNGQQSRAFNLNRSLTPDRLHRPPEKQQVYRGARTASIKGTTYDRVALTNMNSRR